MLLRNECLLIILRKLHVPIELCRIISEDFFPYLPNEENDNKDVSSFDAFCKFIEHCLSQGTPKSVTTGSFIKASNLTMFALKCRFMYFQVTFQFTVNILYNVHNNPKIMRNVYNGPLHIANPKKHPFLEEDPDFFKWDPYLMCFYVKFANILADRELAHRKIMQMYRKMVVSAIDCYI